MLIYTRLPVGNIQLYNTDPQEIARIQNDEQFSLLREDIKHHGVKNPVLVEQKATVLTIHIGEQRLWLAQQANISHLAAFVFARRNMPDSIPVHAELVTGVRIRHVKDVLQYFSASAFYIKTKYRQAREPAFTRHEAEQQPAYRTIMRYVEEGIIVL